MRHFLISGSLAACTANTCWADWHFSLARNYGFLPPSMSEFLWINTGENNVSKPIFYDPAGRSILSCPEIANLSLGKAQLFLPASFVLNESRNMMMHKWTVLGTFADWGAAQCGLSCLWSLSPQQLWIMLLLLPWGSLLTPCETLVLKDRIMSHWLFSYDCLTLGHRGGVLQNLMEWMMTSKENIQLF